MAKKYENYGIDTKGEITELNSTDEVWIENSELACVATKKEAKLISDAVSAVGKVDIDALHGLADHVRNGGIRSIERAVDFLRSVISPSEFGTASEVAEAVGVARTTLITAANRGEIVCAKTNGGTLLIDIAAAKRWAKGTRKTGPKPKT